MKYRRKDLNSLIFDVGAFHACTNSRSREIAISSLTRKPPALSAVFHVKPKSFRLIRAVADKPIRVFPQALTSIPEVCGLHQRLEYHVASKGLPQPMNPAIRDDTYRIAREAIVNAFRHSQATNIDVRLKYTWRRLHLLVCDNGVGIGELVVRQETNGHWGLHGMREPPQGIGAKLTFITSLISGTVVELIVPGRVAFQPKLRRKFSWLFLRVEQPSNGEEDDDESETK